MTKAICFVIFAILLCGAGAAARASALEIGAKFDIERLAGSGKAADSTIVAFVPSLTYDCEYASMLTQSFYFYFDSKMAFGAMDKIPNIRVFIIVRDGRNEAKSMQNIIGGMKVIYDEKGELFSHFGVESPYGKNANSTVLLLDSNEKIALLDTSYRAQGEHLKPLEYKLKQLNGVAVKLPASTAPQRLKVGDPAPNFVVEGAQTLQDLRGQVVLVSFYPAAFSGTFPRPYDAGPAAAPEAKTEQITLAGAGAVKPPEGFSAVSTPHSVTMPAGTFSIDRSFDQNKFSAMSCSFQIVELDKPGDKIKTARRILVSSSTRPLLDQWRRALDTVNIIYANDPDYRISAQYLSYNPAGYNNRVTVIVDQKGRIAYIDDSFDAADEPVIEGKINELLKKSK